MHLPICAPAGGAWWRRVICAATLIATTVPASAMRIMLTNDDGFESPYIQALYTGLKAAGHDVMMSAPYRDQSGVSASLGVLSAFPATTAASPRSTIAAGAPGAGPTTLGADQYYVDGTPVAAIIYGIETLAPAKWGSAPDLVISGPNIGSNLGTVTPHSGTVGATITALNWGVPAIAMSTASTDTAVASLLTAITLRVISAASVQGKIALPAGTGLNVNTPVLDAARAPASYRYAFTQISTAETTYDTNPLSERNALADGNTVTISPIQGTYQAPPDKAAQVLTRMRSLFATSIPITNPKLSNLSVRGSVGTGSAVQIVGLAVTGSSPKTMLIRASGSALTTFGVTGALADPVVELHDEKGQILATNDNWGDDPAAAVAIAAAAAKVGAFAWTSGSPDAALLIALSPGLYTVVVRGARNTTGTALVETYDAQVD